MRDTIEMAREAGVLETFKTLHPSIEILVDLARADERAALMQLFTDPENQPTQHGTVMLEHMQREVAVEREACAKVCETKLGPTATDFYGKTYAAAIRARGETK